ncbi:MAG: hypothetical protein KF709_05700 [Gemmatimonadaceae bacterium]|nr:hypothetical protein [Gemmatimonadaceae bacterium]
MPGIVDFHSHVIPSVDDGSTSIDQSLTALRAFAEQGVVNCVLTPHFDASLTRNSTALAARLGEFDRSWTALCAAVENADGLPQLHRGCEVMLDEPDADLSDPRIRLDGGRFVLCEFPSLRLPPNAEIAIHNLVDRGWQPIVAHPERYRNLDAGLERLRRLRDAGAYFQLNATSLIGRHGEQPARVARRLLELGWGEYLSSDYHARGIPGVAKALANLREWGGAAQALRMSEENPARMLAGESPEPVSPLPPAARSSWIGRLLSRTDESNG